MQPLGLSPQDLLRRCGYIPPSKFLRYSILNMVHYVIWVILFAINLSNNNNNNNNKCTGPMLTNSSLVFWILVAISCSYIGIVFMRFYIYWKCTEHELPQGQYRYLRPKCLPLSVITRICQICLTLSAFVLMCIAFGSKDSCPDLQDLVLGFIIVWGVIYGSIMVAVCGRLIIMTVVRVIHQKRAIQQNQQILVIVPAGEGYQQQVIAPIQIQEVEIGSQEREPMRDGRV